MEEELRKKLSYGICRKKDKCERCEIIIKEIMGLFTVARKQEQELISKIFEHSNMATEQAFGKGVVERFKDVLYRAFNDEEERSFWQKKLDKSA